MTQTATTADKGVLEVISARIAAVTPEQYKMPSNERPEGRPVLGYADDYIKRVFTLQVLLRDEAMPLVTELDELTETFLQAARESDSMEKTIKYFSSNGEEKLKQWARLQELNKELYFRKRQNELLGKVFWYEVKKRVPAVADTANIAIYSDWSFADCKDDVRAEAEESLRAARESFADLVGGFV